MCVFFDLYILTKETCLFAFRAEKSCFRCPMSVATVACPRKRQTRQCFSRTPPVFRGGSPVGKKNANDSFSFYDVDVVGYDFLKVI